MRELMDVVIGGVIILFGYFVGTLVAFFGSAFFLAILTRGAWHARLVAKGERDLVDWWLAFDLPVVFMAVAVGELVAVFLVHWFSLDPDAYERVFRGSVVALAYLGPEGLLALMPRLWRRRG